MSKKHFCMGTVVRLGRHYWGSPSAPPRTDTIPPELLEKHPDTLTFWELCPSCGTAVCGKPALFALKAEDGSPDVHLCAEHYDEVVKASKQGQITPMWHDCLDMKQEFARYNSSHYRLDRDDS